jgi:hypothetical protein
MKAWMGHILIKAKHFQRFALMFSNSRRLAKDYERHIKSVIAFVKLAMTKIVLRSLTGKAS